MSDPVMLANMVIAEMSRSASHDENVQSAIEIANMGVKVPTITACDEHDWGITNIDSYIGMHNIWNIDQNDAKNSKMRNCIVAVLMDPENGTQGGSMPLERMQNIISSGKYESLYEETVGKGKGKLRTFLQTHCQEMEIFSLENGKKWRIRMKIDTQYNSIDEKSTKESIRKERFRILIVLTICYREYDKACDLDTIVNGYNGVAQKFHDELRDHPDDDATFLFAKNIQRGDFNRFLQKYAGNYRTNTSTDTSRPICFIIDDYSFGPLNGKIITLIGDEYHTLIPDWWVPYLRHDICY